MATFTFEAYPHQTMGSTSANDFTLFPAYDWPQDPSFLPTTTYQDQAYLQATSFDYNQQYQYNTVQYLAKPQQPQHPLSPRQSPAHSTTHSFEAQQNFLSSVSDSGASAHSTISSAMASPHVVPQSSEWSQQNYYPIVQNDETFVTAGLDFETLPVMDTKGCVDPSLIQPFSPFPEVQAAVPSPQVYAPIPSPAPSVRSARSPHVQQQWQPYPSRRPSLSSVHSRQSQASNPSDDTNRGLCPIPSCGRQFKDLKAHMLTHQETRPEKCPIPTCAFHVKGFARKYDKNRHTLTHYKGTMVCGFCPGSGSAAEKSFNRADVFKRHLTSVHNVEQTPPNARRKSPPSHTKRSYGMRDASGTCSTCNNVFANPQDFYEHLDDCVLRVVQQADPSEAVNQQLLSTMTDDVNVQATMERHMLSNDLDGAISFDEEEEEEDDEEEDGTRKRNLEGRKGVSCQSTHPRGVSHVGGGNHITSGGAVCKSRRGLTYSKGGVPPAGAMTGKGNKRRKNYPVSWGAAPEKMRMKKRVLCVFDGDRRLWKDDMMLDSNHEVRIPLHGVGDGRAWVSDLDVCTLKRAEGLHNATDEEKGPRLSEEEVEQLMS